MCKYKGEAMMHKFLTESNMCPTSQEAFCVKGRKVIFDFRVGNTFIEVDGKQHFQPIPGWKSGFDVPNTDIIKEEFAKKNGYAVIRVPQRIVLYNTDWKEFVISALESIGTGEVVCYKSREYSSGIYARLRVGSFFDE